MKQKLRDELTAAMKSGDKLRTMVLRGVLAEVSRFEVEKDVRREADEAAIVQILKREKARREETLMFARKGGRQDLVDQNEAELKIIEGYLPAAVSEDELARGRQRGDRGRRHSDRTADENVARKIWRALRRQAGERNSQAGNRRPILIPTYHSTAPAQRTALRN